MNTIQYYGMTNYQTNFQARGGKRVVKTLADLKSSTPIERKLDKIRKILMKMECKPNCNGDAFINEGIGPQTMLGGVPLGDYRLDYLSKHPDIISEYRL